MKDLQKKCSFIDWRDKVEEMVEKLNKNERITLDQIYTVLEEGADKGFMNRSKGSYAAISSEEPFTQNLDGNDENEQLEGSAAATTALF
jgi:hypothetical protein